ncbi:Uma2 family endonuclease [uncultured Thiohalocapsa sp.]|uniref:Uma2 family endonuclease n=1 Tax=uncultured Thiohalocapsa sp. TaxID=768990 RepID=UPI0025F40BE5|nr:Uma2 family endonuclease [uncultured Thiohalocapsa sp.]
MPPTAIADAPTAPIPDPERSDTGDSADGRMVSEAEYWRDWYHVSDITYEWNNGRLEEKPVSEFETLLVYKWLLLLLEHFLAERPIAASLPLEMGFRLALPTGTVIRRPDLAVVRHDNPTPISGRDCSYRGVYDLCIEVLSDTKPSHMARDTVNKKAEYAAGGVNEYWIIHRSRERQAFYRRTADGRHLPIQPSDGVIESVVLPGFRFRLDDLERQPSWIALRDDPVYADFVLPQWTRDRQTAAAGAARALAAETRAAEAEARAADAEARANAEAAARRALEKRLARLEAARSADDGPRDD